MFLRAGGDPDWINMKNIFKNKSGMTLIELLVSISIIATMSTLYIVNVRSYNKSGDLINAAHELANNIRLAQNFALGLKEADFGSGPEMPGNGWGIYIKTPDPFYVIYAVSDANVTYDGPPKTWNTRP